MKHLMNKIGLFGTFAILLVVACSFVSGTWVLTYKLVEDEDLVWNDDFYYGSVDLTTDKDWKDNVEHLKDINMIGLEVWARNNTDTDQKYWVFVADKNSTLSAASTRSEVDDKAVRIIDQLPIKKGGKTFIPYDQSLKYVMNVDKLKKVLETGEMKFFAYSLLNTNTDLHIDSVNVVITFTAGLK